MPNGTLLAYKRMLQSTPMALVSTSLNAKHDICINLSKALSKVNGIRSAFLADSHGTVQLSLLSS